MKVTPPAQKYSLTVTSSQGGSVDTSGGSYDANTSLTIKATPTDGYEFSGWSGNASGNENPLTISINGNKNITANFTSAKVDLVVTSSDGGSVNVESGEYNKLTQVSISASPTSGYIFIGWTGSLSSFDNPLNLILDNSKNINANFEELIDISSQSDKILGSWKFNINDSASRSEIKEIDQKALKGDCNISEIIFRKDNSFTIITANSTFRGDFSIESNLNINLNVSQSRFGIISNIELTNSFISMSISLESICSQDLNGNKNQDYNESIDNTIPPIISLIGNPTIYIKLGENFLDPGATASDNIDGDISSSITTSGTVDTNKAGTYEISYTATDSQSDSTTVSRIIIVSSDSPPLISLQQSSTIEITVGETFTDPGATATDDNDGDLTNSIITSGEVNSSSAGTYTIVYSVSDSGNNTSSVSRTIIVKPPPDLTAPSISLIGNSTIYITVGNAFSDPGVNATDNVDGNLNSSIITTGSVDTSTEGNYTLTYSVSDSSNNTNSITRSIVVVPPDTTPPALTLNGQSVIKVRLGANFTDPGATANDNSDGNISSSISSSGSVDTSAIGTYIINYSVSDSAGNSSSVSRTVEVSSIYFENGTCKCPNATVGDTAVINGTTYKAVNNSSIAGEIANGNVNLCTTLVNNMKNLFADNNTFNSNISFWDTSNVTSMYYMFHNAYAFNQPIGNWDTSKVTNMHVMFGAATSFNQPIGNWNTSNVTTMHGMFGNTYVFNQNIGNWNVSNVQEFESMFHNAYAFNQNISGWDVSKGNDFKHMFYGAREFNQDLSNWCVRSMHNPSIYPGASPINNFDSGATAWNLPRPDWGYEHGCTSGPWGFANYYSYSINVTASSSNDYTLSGTARDGQISGNDPSITLARGDTINFVVNAPGHPFYLKTVQGTGTANTISGVTNNGATNGTVSWRPTQAGTYYYICSLHGGMIGTISVN